MKYPISVGVLSQRKLREMFNFQKKILPLGLLLLPRLGGAGAGRVGGFENAVQEMSTRGQRFLEDSPIILLFGEKSWEDE